MALSNTAADAAVDIWVASLTPAPPNPNAIRDAMRPLVRAIYAGIVANAVVTPTSLVVAAAPGAVTGTGTIV